MPQKNDHFNLTQQSPKKTPGFECFRSHNKYFFHFNDLEKRIILFSQAYPSKKNRDRGLNSVRKNACDPARYTFHITSDNKHYFHIKASNNKIMARSNDFESQKEAEAAKAQLMEAVINKIDLQDSATKTVVHTQENQQGNTMKTRYRFNLTFRKASEEAPLVGTVEFPLTKEKATFEGLDLESIGDFLKNYLPNKDTADIKYLSKPAQKLVASKKTPTAPKPTWVKGIKLARDVEFLTQGKTCRNNVFDNNKVVDILLSLQGQKDFAPNTNYTASIIAKSLKAGRSIQICSHQGSIPSSGKIAIPLSMRNIIEGPYRLVINVIVYNTNNPDYSKEINTDKVIQVYSNY